MDKRTGQTYLVVVGILTFLSRKKMTSLVFEAGKFLIFQYFSLYEQLKSVVSRVEHEKSFISLRPARVCAGSGLQIYCGPGSMSHDFKIWPITFQGSGPSGVLSFLVVKKSLFNRNIHLTRSLELHKTESTCR